MNDQPLQLPCPEELLVGIAIALGDSRRLSKLLLRSPSLLVYSCHQFFQTCSRAPDCGNELLDWLGDGGADQFRDLPQGWSLGVSRKRIRKWACRCLGSIHEFQMPSGNKRLRKALFELFKSIPDQDSAGIKDWIGRIIGKGIKGKHFFVAAESSPEWQVGYEESRAEAIMELACSASENLSEFQRRLKQEKLRSLKQLAYGASHEINNPLANIATRAQSLLADEANPERRRKLALIFEQSMRAHEMISDLMLFAHPPKPTFELTDVYELIKTVASEMRPALRRRTASVDVRRYPGVCSAWIDKTQIAVAIKAMLRNSLESFDGFAKIEDLKNDTGRIIVRIWPQGDSHLEISITDNGPGLTVPAARHLFDPFFSGREAGRGLGFGLSKAWRISELHHGQLEWDESYTEGTRFVLRIPRVQHAVARIDKAEAA